MHEHLTFMNPPHPQQLQHEGYSKCDEYFKVSTSCSCLYNKYLEKEDPKVSPNKLLFLVTAVKMMIGHRFGQDEIMSVVWQAENFYSFPL